jgi:xanthine dehydrogenase accessory factor
VKLDTLRSLEAARSARKPLALVTRLSDAAQALIFSDSSQGDLWLNSVETEQVRQQILADESATIGEGPSRLFVQIYNPPPRIILVGAVHISQPLVRMAQQLDYDVILIDPRRAFATADRFPGLDLRHDWPDVAMRAVAPDRRTAVVTLTHDPKLDDPALSVALHSDAFYIGALGSRKTHAARLKRLSAEGFSANDLARIKGPVGLSIGAESPAEIAVSILADITAVRRSVPAAREAA